MLIQNSSSVAQAPLPTAYSNGGVAEAVVAATPQPRRVTTQETTSKQPSHAELRSVVDSINQALRQSSRDVEFSIDESTNKQVVKLVDKTTGDLIRQYPSEEMLAVSRAIDQFQKGLLLRQEA
jgi:flagellar protein FlaG